MSQKTERPTLQGQRLRTRKRDEKEKFNPTGFRDIILNSFVDNFDIDAVIKCLLYDIKVDYRIYGEQLFDIIIAGGILAPGGSIVVDSDSSKPYRTDVCLFKAVDVDDLRMITKFASIFVRLIQRFGYLEKTLEEEFKKIIVFLKGFEEDERIKLAKLAAVLINAGLLSPIVLLSGIKDHLVKDGYALDFLINCLKTCIIERDPGLVWNSMRKVGIDKRLLDFLPPNKRSLDTLIQSFQQNGLDLLVGFLLTKESDAKKSELQRKIIHEIKAKAQTKDIVKLIKDAVDKDQIEYFEVLVLIWQTLMSIVAWNKKEELVTEQALRHLRAYAPIMEPFSKSAKAQLALLIRIQEHCYENINFLKSFSKIIILFYKADVLTEDVIIDWYQRAHSSKGKSVFLEQLKPFVEWLTAAEEESEEE